MGRAEINEINPGAAVAVWDQRLAEGIDFLRKHGKAGWFVGALDNDGVVRFTVQFFPSTHEIDVARYQFAIFMLACMEEAQLALTDVARAEVS